MFVCITAGFVSAQDKPLSKTVETTADKTNLNSKPVEAYLSKDLTQKAVILKTVEPSYTKKARKRQVEGNVKIKVILRADGQVEIVEVLEALPHGLTEKAIEAARKIKFKPAIKDGKTVSQYATLSYVFNVY